MNRDSSPEAAPAHHLLSAAAARERAHQLLEHGLAGRLEHFTVHPERLGACADEVVATIKAAYPDLEVPFHARWRHFTAGGFDRWGALREIAAFESDAAMARAAFDLAIVSVLLDAGAGPAWRYEEGRTGETYTRSEGLAVASFDMFIGGSFSNRPEDPFRVDGEALAALSADELAAGFQVSETNPLLGLDARAALLRRLGQIVVGAPEVFGREDDPRPGGLFDVIAATAQDGSIAANVVLQVLLEHLGPIWPSRIVLGGVDLGDTWRHPLAHVEDASDGLVPFHKLSQWLAYSLLEPLSWAGFEIENVDGLTGLPEYRNGGLFLDTGVLALRDPADAARSHEVGSPLVVEWRALTVALLDRVADLVRQRLDLSAEEFPLAKVLEGGTWATGRRLARERRADGSPPLSIVSDGTVF
ncbi:MAG: URC4/urg3 family protein [Microvirga sp.]